MQPLQRTTLASARNYSRRIALQTRRFAHDTSGHAHNHASASEPIGMGFWGAVALIPAGTALYYVSHSDDQNTQPLFTRVIDQYTAKQEHWAERNGLHTRMIQQAGEDRLLFQKARSYEYFDMRFPEMMNVGSPYNVPAGSQVQLEKVIEKYQKIAYEDNERKLEALRNNSIKSEQQFDLRDRLRRPSEE